MRSSSLPPGRTLITSAHIFDGKGDTPSAATSVLVEGNKIAKIDDGLEPPADAIVIDAGGRVMTPGFIDAHYHLALASTLVEDVQGSYAPDQDFLGISAVLEGGRALMRGFTSLRDAGGPSWGAKLAFDRDLHPGPRVWPSLRVISQFGGHGDGSPRCLHPGEFGGPENFGELIGFSRIVNGRAQMLAAVREQLKRGASQIKLMLGGGVGTEFDPIDGLQFTADEIRAAVEAAENFGTYCMGHVYTDRGIVAAVENGVKSVEHGNLAGEDALRAMAERGAWLSPQCLVYATFTEDLGPERLAKGAEVRAGLGTLFALAKKHGVRVVFGTDVVFNPVAAADQNGEFVYRAEHFSPAEVLRQATSEAGELLQLSGLRSPYPGKLGVVEEGALADILLIDGDPLEDISILTKPEENISLIMKDGKIYKNLLN